MGIFVVSYFLCIIHSYLSSPSLSLPSLAEGKRALACEGFSGPVPGGGRLSAGDKLFRGGLMAELS